MQRNEERDMFGDRLLWSRLREPGAIERVLRERLSEPLHLNLFAAFVALFGSYRAKIYFDLVHRPYTAFGLLDSATRALACGHKSITVLEFGVASGAGLLNICRIAARLEKEMGAQFRVYGFDTGEGLPKVESYRDHPELYQVGDYRMPSWRDLEARLPKFAELIIGPIAETLPGLLNRLSSDSPLGYVSLDVDYYSSSVGSLPVFAAEPELYLPLVVLYLDDCHNPYHNPAAGELLALIEFCRDHPMRQAFPYTALREGRLFKNASWISKVWAMHILDHPVRTAGAVVRESKSISNAYLGTSAGLSKRRC